MDVTNKVKKLFTGNKLKFTHSYNDIFGDPLPGKRKHLKIESSILPTFKVKEDFPFTLSLKPSKAKIKVVYFINIFCAPEYYHFLLEEHLRGLIKCGLSRRAEIYIEVSADNPKVIDEIKSILPSAHVTLHDNSHEYPGIKRVWQLGQEKEDSFILYFHSKGITRLEKKMERDPLETLLYNDLVDNWRDCVNFLSYFPSLDKIGRFMSGPGWSWHNFFWVRSSYVRECEEPLKTERRHYYEDWIGRKKNKAWRKSEVELHFTPENYKFNEKNFLSTCSLPGDLDPGHQMRRVDPHGEICHLGESYTA